MKGGPSVMAALDKKILCSVQSPVFVVRLALPGISLSFFGKAHSKDDVGVLGYI